MITDVRSATHFAGSVRRTPWRLLVPTAVALGCAVPAALHGDDGVPCGGDFPTFVEGLKEEAVGRGIDRSIAEGFLADVTLDPDVIRRDRSQGIFRKSFIEFSKLGMAE